MVWQSSLQDGDSFGIYATRISAAGVLSGEFQVNLATPGDQTTPVVSMAPSGSFMVVWRSNVGDGDQGAEPGQPPHSGATH